MFIWPEDAGGMKMYRIMDFVWKKEPAGFPRLFVHSFYKTMFMKLYGVDEKEAGKYVGKNGAVTDSCDFLYPLVKTVWERNQNRAAQFYDIRTNEEAGQPAPEYAILKKAGIKNISPIGIKGMGSMAFLMGLQMTELAVNEGECAIMLLAEMEHDLESQEENTACAFALCPCQDAGNQEGIWITEYLIHLTACEIRDAVKKFCGTAIFSDTVLDDIPMACSAVFCGKHGLTAPFLYLHKASEEVGSADVLSIYSSGNNYGLVRYHVSGKGYGH